MQDNVKIRIATTGGLGNQLFQFAAALNYSNKRPVEVDRNLLVNNNSDIFKFISGEFISEVPFQKVSWVSKKLANELLRSSRGVKSLHPKDWYPIMYRRVTSYCLKHLYLRNYKVLAPAEIGFDRKFDISAHKSLLVGYFQSYKWFEKIVVKDVFRLQESAMSVTFKALRSTAEKSHPIIVHIRLGDYISSKDMQILPSEYYKKALLRLRQDSNIDEVWVFSNETSKVEQYLPLESGHKFRIIDEDLSAAQSLELMRFGSAYVIGNSTFSWWGAYLKYNPAAPVYYPSTWFKSIKSPNMMHPNDWEALDI